MKAKSQLVSTSLTLLGFAAMAVITGCQQPYSYAPYAPYQQAPYGAPINGQPAYGQPIGPAGSGTVSPPISSVPPENNLRSSQPNGNNAPKFNSNKPGATPGSNSVPNPANGPDSPYFQQESSRVPTNTFIPETAATSPVIPANFINTAQAPGNQPASFEMPMPSDKKPEPPQTIDDPFGSQQVKPMPIELETPKTPASSSLFPLPPPAATKKTAAVNDGALEGTVRQSTDNQWVLEFGTPDGPNGGKFQLTGAPEVLKVLQDGRRYRVKGVIESPAANPTQKQYRIEQAQLIDSSIPSIK
ncbi:MAG: hypothetical protein JKY95_11050 [Planctomycetaceae bacterium]|nr:hypothetical protein [Planctomycetaceae bacterium]